MEYNNIWGEDMENILRNKLIFNALNLDYPRANQNYINQTNTTISTIMNDFIKQYYNNFKDTYFILLYNDDIYSLIAYQILKNIQGIYPFKLKILGKRKNTKIETNKKDFLNYFQLNKIKKENIIYISCFNPIYKVKNSILPFKELRNNCYNIIEKFTPIQFKIMTNFYAIKNNKLLSEFNNGFFEQFCDFSNSKGFFQKCTLIFTNPYFDNIIKDIKTLDLIQLQGNEEDFLIFDQIVKTSNNHICFYYYDINNKEFLMNNLNSYINPANIICNNNSNNITISNTLIKNGLIPNFIGNWLEKDKEKFLNR